MLLPANRRTRILSLATSAALAAGIPVGWLLQDDRHALVARTRFAVIWAARACTGASFPEIGQALGGKDHTTILYGVTRAEKMRAEDATFRAFCDRLVVGDSASKHAGLGAVEDRRQLLLDVLHAPLCGAARGLGYALALHGAAGVDIDLLAAPWTEAPAAPHDLCQTVIGVADALVGCAWIAEGSAAAIGPHGRLGWLIQLGGGVSIDLTVIPPRTDT